MTCCQNWKTDASWIYFGSGSADFRNPVQGGNWDDCTFLAALTSMAWTNPASIAVQDAQKTLTYIFYDGGTITASINNNLLVVDPAATPLCFCGAKSNLFDSKKEVWPALYEKAYAKYRFYKKGLISTGDLNIATKWPLDASGNPVSPCTLTCDEWGGNPVTVLGILTGCQTQVQRIYQKDGNGMPIRTSPYDLYCAALMSTYKDSGYADGSYIWQFIKNCFCSTVGWVNKTKKPMVAWTYKNNSYLPSGKSFSPTGIRENHSYAILGTFTYNKKYYVVLRDPYCLDPSSATISLATGIYQYFNGTADFCPKGVGGFIESPGNKTSLSFGDQDGVFGLEAYELKTYFEGFGWIP
jgi:hypothetical protein